MASQLVFKDSPSSNLQVVLQTVAFEKCCACCSLVQLKQQVSQVCLQRCCAEFVNIRTSPDAFGPIAGLHVAALTNP